jgi:hypothetical protein
MKVVIEREAGRAREPTVSTFNVSRLRASIIWRDPLFRLSIRNHREMRHLIVVPYPRKYRKLDCAKQFFSAKTGFYIYIYIKKRLLCSYNLRSFAYSEFQTGKDI